MARLVHHHTYLTLRLGDHPDVGRWLLLALQVAVIGSIGLFIALAVVNTVAGTPQPEPGYRPYG